MPPGERAERRPPGSPSRPFFTASLRGGAPWPNALSRWEEVLTHERSIGFALARALLAAGGASQEAVALARHAETGYAQAGGPSQQELARVRRWLLENSS